MTGTLQHNICVQSARYYSAETRFRAVKYKFFGKQFLFTVTLATGLDFITRPSSGKRL
jgi:hypothetical protein